MRRNRLETHYLRPREPGKDNEGNTYVEYGLAKEFTGESWPASGRVQAQMYGEKLPYVRNVKIQGDYVTKRGEDGVIRYVFESGLTVCEKDGLCLDVGEEDEPDYEIVAIIPYKPLRLEAMRR